MMNSFVSGLCQRTSRQFHQQNQGQVTLLFLFSMLIVVVLLAFILNTGVFTTRKVQMQGAADATATAGSIWLARGMNTMVSNNQKMTQVLSVMITVRATYQTAQKMAILLPRLAAAVAPWNPALSAQLFREALAYQRLALTLRQIDQTLIRTGWTGLRALDQANQVLKVSIPVIALKKAVDLAEMNGADWGSRGFLIPGEPDGLLPLLPVARGPQQLLIGEVEKCPLPQIKNKPLILFLATGPISSPLAYLYYRSYLQENLTTLKSTGSGSVREVGDIPPLSWPDSPPRPMILTESPTRQPAATVTHDEQNLDLLKISQYLNVLGVATGKNSGQFEIGNRYFQSPTHVWITYGQTAIYNPTRWSMFTQDWRQKLVRASLIDSKTQKLMGLAGGMASIPHLSDWSFVNTH